MVFLALLHVLGAHLLIPSNVLSQEEAREPPIIPRSVTVHGLPGAFTVPIAADLPIGSADLYYNRSLDHRLARDDGADEQFNVGFALGMFPRLVFAAGGSEVDSPDVLGPLVRDVKASFHLLVLREGRFTPAVAGGIQDVGGGGPRFRSRYGVMSKTLPGPIRLSGGYGSGPDVLDGPFGAAEWAPHPRLTLLGEYDAEQLRGGLRVLPVPEALVSRGFPRAAVDLHWSEEEGFSWGVTARALLDLDLLERAPGQKGSGSPSSPGGFDDGGVHEGIGQLGEHLVHKGFENVRVTWTASGDLLVEYENRRYNQNELDGLSRVIESVALHLEEPADTVRILVKETDVPVLEVRVAATDLRAFLQGELTAGAFGERLSVRYASASARSGSRSPTVNRSRLKADFVFGPGVETVLFSDLAVAEARFHLLPVAQLHLFRGTVADVRFRVPLLQTSRFRIFGGPLPDPDLDRALVHHARWLAAPGSGSALLLGQWSLGRFAPSNVGVRQELALALLRGTLLLGSDFAVTGEDAGELDRILALGSARLLIPRWNARLTVTGGRFLDEDLGVTTEVSRFFGDTEMGVFLRHSERSSLAGVRLTIPLAPERDLRPARVRPRTPSRWSYSHVSTVFEERNIIRFDIARLLPTGRPLTDVLLDRDRLHPLAVGRELGSARFWRH